MMDPPFHRRKEWHFDGGGSFGGVCCGGDWIVAWAVGLWRVPPVHAAMFLCSAFVHGNVYFLFFIVN